MFSDARNNIVMSTAHDCQCAILSSQFTSQMTSDAAYSLDADELLDGDY